MINLAKSQGVTNIDVPLALKLMILTPLDVNGNWISGQVPVFLPVNPDNWDVDYQKKVNIDFTALGFVVNHWHDDIIRCQASGYLPTFQSRAKILTESYQDFLALLRIYAQCGKVTVNYNKIQTVPTGFAPSNASVSTATTEASTGVVGKTSMNAGEISALQVTTQSVQIAQVRLQYQNDAYIGVFKNFQIKESYDEPNTLKYSFEFAAFRREDAIDLGILQDIATTAAGVLPLAKQLSPVNVKLI